MNEEVRRKREEGRKKKLSLFLLLSCFLLLTACSQKPAPVTHHGVQEGAGSAGIHTILKNETLYNVSKRYKLPMRDIITANKLDAPYHLQIGQRLKLPPPRNYVVRGGDTLQTIARLFDVSASEMVRLNDLGDPYKVYDGETLRIPPPLIPPRPQARPQQPEEQTAQIATISPVDKPTPLSQPSSKGGTITPDQKPTRPKRVAVKKSRPTKVTTRTPARASNKFLKPVRGKTISSYGSKPDGRHNDGINILAARGTPVKAAENGVVVYVGNDLKGTGNLILVRHADRWMSAYAHLDQSTVTRGQTIKRGAKIGTVGSTGSVDKPQLHFELRRGTKALNPKAYVEG